MSVAEIYVEFQETKYKIIFTKHALDRMKQRWINLNLIIESIEKYDNFYESYLKKVVEKRYNSNTMRTVFDIKEDNIILITSMFLWK